MTSAKASVMAAIQKAADKTAISRTKKKQKKNATSYFTMWNDALIDKSGTAAQYAPTIAALGRMKKAIERLPLKTPKEIESFITWVVTNWEQIGEDRFSSKNSKYPEEPALQFFLVAIETFHLAYCRKQARPLQSKRGAEANKFLSEQLTAEKAKVALLTKQNEALLKRIAELEAKPAKRKSKKGDASTWL